MSTRPRREQASTDAVNDTGVDLNTPGASKSPKMPHERDEKVGMTGGVPSDVVQQGHEDLERGLEDTSRGAESDDAYRKLKKK